MKRINWAIQTAIFYLFTWSLATIPQQSICVTGRKLGRLMFRLLAKRREIAIENIRLALPFMKQHTAWTSTIKTADEIALETFIHLAKSIIEICHLYHGKGSMTIDTIEVRGREHFDLARKKHQGIIFVGGHCGNWELMALSFRKLFGESMSGVARKQNNPFLNTVIEKMRTKYDNQVIYKQGALKPILAVLKKDGIVGILADQAVFPEDGVLIDFLGRKAWANKAPVIIARKSKVPLVPVFIHRESDRHIISFHPEYELGNDISDKGIQQDVQALSSYLEDFVCAHPADWYWVHRRWKRAGEDAQ